MSELTTAARPYANAVYQIASQTAKLADWGDALALMAAVVADASMAEKLSSPQLGRTQKGELLLAVVGDKLNAEQKNMVLLMAENNRLTLLPTVAELYEEYRAEAEGHIEAVVTSAFPLTDEQSTSIANALKNKTGRDVTITTTTDASLLGGVIIKAGDIIIDGSMKTRLATLASTLGR
jgi:F-type H+-transporting ATPase subunit delta